MFFQRSYLLLSLTLLPTTSVAMVQDDAEVQYRFLAGLCAEGHWELAVKEGRQFLQHFPKHERATLARYRLATALFELDRRPEAALEFRPLAELQGFAFAAETNLRLGQCELDAGRWDAARQALLRAKQSDQVPLKAHAAFLLGEVGLRTADYAGAAQALRESLALDPKANTTAHAQRGLIWCEYHTGAFAKAMESAQAFLQAHPDGELAQEVRFVLGEALAGAGNWREAQAAYAQVESGPFLPAALRGLGLARAQLQDHVGAAAAFLDLLQRFPESPYAREARLHAAAHSIEAGNADQAVKLLAEPKKSEDPEWLYWRAKALAAAGSTAAALPILDQALQHANNPEWQARIQTLRGEWLYGLGRNEESAQAFLAARSDYGLHAAATAHLAAGRTKEALQAADQLIADFPDSPYRPAVERLRAEALFAAGEYDASEAAWAPIASQDSRSPDDRAQALSRMAWCRYLQGDPSAAAQGFDQVTAGFGDQPQAEEALYMAGLAWFEAGDSNQAIERWKAYRKQHSSGPHAEEAMLGLGRAQKDPAVLQALLQEHPNSPVGDQALLELARWSEAGGDLDAAVTSYHALITRFPDSPFVGDALYGGAWCLQSLKRPQEAIPVLQLLLQQKNVANWRQPAQELLLWCALDAKDWDLALQAWPAVQESDLPQERKFAACLAWAQALNQAGQRAQALARLKPWETKDRDPQIREQALVAALWIQLDAGDLQACEARLAQIPEFRGPRKELAEAAFFVGEAQYAQQAWKQAESSYRLAADLPGSEVADRALYKLGFAQFAQDDPRAAATSFQTLCERFPENESGRSTSPLTPEATYLWGEALWRAGDTGAAMVPLSRFLTDHPNHEAVPKALFRLGQTQLAEAHPAEAEKLLADLVRRFGDFDAWAEAEWTRGQCLVQLYRPKEARAAFARVLARDKGVISARARLSIGALNLAEDDVEGALTEYLKVALLYSQPEEVSQAQFLAGDCLERLDDLEAAKRQYAQAAEDHPKTYYGIQAAKRLADLGR